MSEKRKWLLTGGASALVVVGAAFLIWHQEGEIETARGQVDSLRQSIASARKLLTGTPQVEREVIVLRETEEAIKEILPDEQDVNNFVRDLRQFEENSEVHITSLKKKPADVGRGKELSDFDKVAYQITLESDAFQLLAFLDRIESHSRFMTVPSFKLTAASRKQVEQTGVPAHKVQLDVETYVYEPQKGPAPVKVEGYARKRELLLGEISRRRQALAVPSYVYRGKLARRDPWVDPRTPVPSDDAPGLTVQEQQQIVDELMGRARAVSTLWQQARKAANVVEEMTLRAELEQKLARLEEEVALLVDQGSITYVPAERRLHNEVLEPLTGIRAEIATSESGRGPTADTLRELLATMVRYLDAGEHNLALEAFATVERRLELAMQDPVRRALAENLRKKAEEARILADFSKEPINVQAIAIQTGVPPVALINGKTVGEGDLVNKELVVRGIRHGEIEFLYRGVVLVRRF
ncbi:MAG TPA: type 4a pilus biogenesis protein PilO [Planctomycetota bacterium]|nr:type 4a pilus biogenesis protein PilO [Planctomycetota bacterium]